MSPTSNFSNSFILSLSCFSAWTASSLSESASPWFSTLLGINSSIDNPSRWIVKLPAYHTSSVRTHSVKRAPSVSSWS